MSFRTKILAQRVIDNSFDENLDPKDLDCRGCNVVDCEGWRCVECHLSGQPGSSIHCLEVTK